MGASGEFWSSGSGLAAVLAALCAVACAVVMLRRWQFRSGLMRVAMRDDRALLREQREVEASLRQTMSELERAAEAACQRVERQIGRLRTLSDRVNPPVGGAAPPPQPVVEQPPPAFNFRPSTAQPEPISRPRRRRPATNAPARSVSLRPADPRAARALELAASGAAPIDIAGQTGMILGEVELLIGLHAMAPCVSKDSTHNPTPPPTLPSEPKSLA